MFSDIADQPVKLRIDDPFLASGDRNRAALVEFLRTLKTLKVQIQSLTLSWKPTQPGMGYRDERPDDQLKDLSERLRKIGLGADVLHMKPRTSRTGHFHDRIVTPFRIGRLMSLTSGTSLQVSKISWNVTDNVTSS